MRERLLALTATPINLHGVASTDKGDVHMLTRVSRECLASATTHAQQIRNVRSRWSLPRSLPRSLPSRHSRAHPGCARSSLPHPEHQARDLCEYRPSLPFTVMFGHNCGSNAPTYAGISVIVRRWPRRSDVLTSTRCLHPPRRVAIDSRRDGRGNALLPFNRLHLLGVDLVR